MTKLKLFGGILGALFVLVPALALAQYQNGSGTLTVYVQVNGNSNCLCSNGTYNCCNNTSYNSYSPSNFTVSVSGNTPSPATFQGSSGGTQVILAPGYYSVNPGTQSNWTYTQFGNCSGNISAGQPLSCTITYTSTNSSYCNQYSGSYCYPYQNYYPYQNQLACVPSYQSAALGSNVVFTAAGGIGTYSWSVAGQSYPNVGSTFTYQANVPGPQTIVVTSDGQTAACTINVVGNGYYNNYPTSYQTGYPGYYYVGPSLPNTGFEPHSWAQFVLAALLLAGLGALSYPYARNAFAYIRK